MTLVPLELRYPEGTTVAMAAPGDNGVVANEAIGPGAQLFVARPDGSFGCTANWLWKDQNDTVHLGTAGHCFMPDEADTTHGEGRLYDASAVKVYVCAKDCYLGGKAGDAEPQLAPPATRAAVPAIGPQLPGADRLPGEWVRLGEVRYARRALAGHDVGNDFGVVTVPRALYPALNPRMPVWGGAAAPSAQVTAGDFAVMHGNGATFGETFLTKSRIGSFVSYGPDSWAATLPSGPGDSGAAVGQVVNEDAATDLHHVLLAGLQTHGRACFDGVGLPQPCTHLLAMGVMVGCGAKEELPVSAGAYCGSEGTTLGRAIAMAKEGGLCLKPLLQDDDPATVERAADCFPTPPAPPPCEPDNRNGLKCCEADDEDGDQATVPEEECVAP